MMMGLVVGAAAGALAVGRVQAQGAPSPPVPVRWEQDCFEARGLEEARGLARSRGTSGWEIVAYDAGILCFKRPLPPSATDALPGY